jgi:hypothetical protein
MYFGLPLFGSCMIGPTLAVAQNLAKVRMRALVASLVALTLNLVGNGFGPLAVGVLSDLLTPRFGVEAIRYALLVPCTLAMMGAATCFYRGAGHFATELEQSQRT